MKRLIVNADDLGLSAAANRGIFDAHTRGIVTAATCLVTLEGFEDAVARAADHDDLDLGLHVNLTWGRPACDGAVPHLAPRGRFRGKRGLALALATRRIPRTEIVEEITAQIAAFTQRVGAPPSHVDVHQHFHAFDRVWDALVGCARQAAIPWVRFPAERTDGGGVGIRWIARRFARRDRPRTPPNTTDHFRGLSYPGRLDGPALDRLLESIPDGLTELMVHPGDRESPGPHPDRLAPTRALERDALTSPNARKSLEAAGIELTTFSAEAARAE